MLVLPGRQGEPIQVHPNVFHDVMDAIPNKGWQVRQEVDGLRVFVVPMGETPAIDDLTRRITAALTETGVQTLTIRVEHVDLIPKAASGKSPLIQAYQPGQAATGPK